MEVLHRLYEYRWIILLLALGGWAVLAALKQATRTEINLLHQRNDPLFRSVLEQHGIGDVEILRDSTIPAVPGSHGRPFTVHLILRSAPDRWWVYIHVEGSDPVLRPISEARARAALG